MSNSSKRANSTSIQRNKNETSDHRNPVFRNRAQQYGCRRWHGQPHCCKKTVSYVCQQGKKVKVTYGFNKQGLTTYASAVINGKRVQMPVNLDKSDNVETFYGKEGGYVLGTGVMDGKSYRKQPIMITAPDNQIVFKDCSPR